MLGVVDPRVPNPEMELIGTTERPAKLAETEEFTVYAVRWPVLNGVYGEGLHLRPKGRVVARVIALPDADQTPETIATSYAGRLAASGSEVIIPTLVDRADTFSGNPRLGRTTNQPHREWIYRQAYELGRHVIGYEVQKVLAAVDWCVAQNEMARAPIGVTGWGEGGLLAFYSAALDPRIDAALVSGYFAPRQDVWQEPIYRNVFGLLREFGDAEIARLIVPRQVIIEHAPAPAVAGPPAPRSRFAGAAPGCITTVSAEAVRREAERAQQLVGPYTEKIECHVLRDTLSGAVSLQVLERLLSRLAGADRALATEGVELRATHGDSGAGERQRRQVAELQQFTQRLLALSSGVRENFFWKKNPPTTPGAWQAAMKPFREKFWSDVIGRFDRGAMPLPLNPRTRKFAEQPKWTGYEVMLDVLPEVFAWGYLLLPNDLQPGEKRPVVVVQHGLEGVPADTINDDKENRAYRAYKAFGARLAERGFIVFAPHNPYRGEDKFRLLQRKANPLGKSLFSIIIAQHDAILDWLATLPNVDATRIGFYGLSYGGKTAMRVPAVLERYALSICSADFNEWIFKNVTTDWPGSYMFTKEWEMFEFDLGSTFNYAEMAALIAPRPFMVERGHDDGVGIDEWVAFEYAKVNRLYAKLKIPERTAIEYFNGPHTINGVGTFQFLHRHLNWPEP